MLIDIGSESYPSFADPDFADVFLAGDVQRAAAWALRVDDTKARGLVSATRMLQRLPWSVLPVPDPTAAAVNIPEVVQEVTAMLASDLLDKPRLFANASGNSNVKSVHAGSAQVDFFRPVDGGPPLPLALWTMLVTAGLMGGGDSPDENAAPVVTGISDDCRPLGGRLRWDWPIVECDFD